MNNLSIAEHGKRQQHVGRVPNVFKSARTKDRSLHRVARHIRSINDIKTAALRVVDHCQRRFQVTRMRPLLSEAENCKSSPALEPVRSGPAK